MNRLIPLALVCLLAACSSSNGTASTSSAGTANGATGGTTSGVLTSSGSSTGAATRSSTGSGGSSSGGGSVGNDGGIIGALTIATIGSTIDPINGDANPYGLTVAPVTVGPIQAGDLVICNFNDSNGVQGNGTTIELMSPTVGSSPVRFVQDPNLQGCNALALDNTDSPWAAALVSNLNPFYYADAGLVSILGQETWYGPWGQAYSAKSGPFGTGSFFVTNSAVPAAEGIGNDAGVSGNVLRIDVLDGGKTFNFDVIASGFSVNAGVPGTVLAPTGLTYDSTSDTLFVVDSNVNRLVALSGVSTLPANSIVANADGSFSGTSASSARVIYSGAPLNGPISSTQLFNGDLVLGNTLDPDGTNLLVEITQSGNLAAVQNVDTGPAGALFGLVATGTSAANMKIYFNDDNDNTVKVLTP